MNAVLVAPGPSLAQLESLPPCDISIAINRAALRFPVSVWAAMDYPMIRDNKDAILGNPILLSHRTTVADLGERVQRFPEIHLLEDFAEFCPVKGWRVFTATAALVYAAYRYATRIDCYGCDWSGKADFDGALAGDNRDEERWAKEAKFWQEIVVWLATRGVEVHRHIPVTA